MIFGLLAALLHGIIFLGGPSRRIGEVRLGVQEHVTNAGRRDVADKVLDEAELVVVNARKQQEVFHEDLQKLLARPDTTPAELEKKLDELDAVEEAAFARIVAARRRLALTVNQDEWRLIFRSPDGR